MCVDRNTWRKFGERDKQTALISGDKSGTISLIYSYVDNGFNLGSQSLSLDYNNVNKNEKSWRNVLTSFSRASRKLT